MASALQKALAGRGIGRLTPVVSVAAIVDKARLKSSVTLPVVGVLKMLCCSSAFLLSPLFSRAHVL